MGVLMADRQLRTGTGSGRRGTPLPTFSHVLTLNTGGYYSAKKGNKCIFKKKKNLLCASGLQ